MKCKHCGSSIIDCINRCKAIKKLGGYDSVLVDVLIKYFDARGGIACNCNLLGCLECEVRKALVELKKVDVNNEQN